MKKMMTCIGLLASVLLSACHNEQMPKQETNTQTMAQTQANQVMMAPNFTLTDLNGQEHTLANYKGKKVFIKFWASWCSICLATLAETDALAKEDTDFVVLSIVAPNYHSEKSTEAFQTWYQTLDYKNLPVLLDNNGTYLQNLGIRAYPSYAVIDSEGALVKVQPGHLPTEMIKAQMAQIK